jgi:hypothetical protein
MTVERLTLSQRKQIFLDLVSRQDSGDDVQRSYQQVTKQHSISDDQLRRIEEEGIANEWPPLDKAVAG